MAGDGRLEFLEPTFPSVLRTGITFALLQAFTPPPICQDSPQESRKSVICHFRKFSEKQIKATGTPLHNFLVWLWRNGNPRTSLAGV